MWDIFSSESEENFLAVEKSLLNIEKNGQTKEDVTSIYRALHTFKGNTRVMGLSNLENVAHIAEDLMALVRDQNVSIDQKIIDTLLLVVDNFRSVIIEVITNKKDISPEIIEPLLKDLKETIAIYEKRLNDSEDILMSEDILDEKILPSQDQMFLSIYFEMVDSDISKLRDFEASDDSEKNETIKEIISELHLATERMGFTEIIDCFNNFNSCVETNNIEEYKSCLNNFIISINLMKDKYNIENTLIVDLDDFHHVVENNLMDFCQIFEELKNLNFSNKEKIITILEKIREIASKRELIVVNEVIEELITAIVSSNIDKIRKLEYSFFKELATIEESSGTKNSLIRNIFNQWHNEQLFKYLIDLRKLSDDVLSMSGKTIKNDDFEKYIFELKEIIKLFDDINNCFRFSEASKISEIITGLKNLYIACIQGSSSVSDSMNKYTVKLIDLLGSDMAGFANETTNNSEIIKLLGELKRETEKNIVSIEISDGIELDSHYKAVMTPESTELLNSCFKENYNFYLINADLDETSNQTFLFYDWLRADEIKNITSITKYVGEKSVFEFLIASKKSFENIKSELNTLFYELNITVFEKDIGKKQKISVAKPDKIITENEKHEINNNGDLKDMDNISKKMDASILKGDSNFLKINSAKVNYLMDLVGEVSLATSSLLAHPDIKNSKSSDLTGLSDNLEVLISTLQEESSNLRLVPIAEIFNRMERLVRDLIKETSKKVELEIFGEDTEIDKMMVEKLYDPLIHIVRNAIDHGLENEEERISKGKSPVGSVKLRAFNKGGEIVISVEDNGAGLNKEKIVNQAKRLGLIGNNELLDEKAIFNLIFHPGFSTADKLSQISGRGVGMDVVKYTINELRGRISIESKENSGTKIRLHLPLTLAFIEGMIVKVNDMLFAIPIVSVSEVINVDPQNLVSVSMNRSHVVKVRDKMVTVFWLEDFYNTKMAKDFSKNKVMVIVKTSKEELAIPVEKLYGNQQITIKPLTGVIKDIKAGAGYGVISSGDVAIVLDCERLYAR